MFKLSKVKVFSLAITGIFTVMLILAWPVYQTLAHKNKIAFPPFYHFIAIPEESPGGEVLYNPAYQNAAEQMQPLLTRHKAAINAPAISAAVAIDNQLIWAGVSGWADIEEKTPVTTESQFRIGSTSKALTGTALARMVDTGQIELDQPISTYMQNLPNQQWQQITPRQLASHMAGLPHYKENTDYLGFYKTLALSTRYEQVSDALSVFDSSELLFSPGSNFSYSSLGTVLLSAVMENAAETPYLDIMQQAVFTPLKMQATMAEFKGESSSNLASFYWNDEGRSQKVRQWRKVDLSHRLAGGGFISTSSDLVKMGMAVLRDDFISPATRKTFWTPQTLPGGSEAPQGYSLGWRVLTRKIDNELGEITFANHGGVSRGAQSWLMVIPEYQMSVAVNINANTEVFWDFAKISMQIAKAFIQERKGLYSKTKGQVKNSAG
ncbi:beta-lactamase family protein [Thalassomonas actiniarum]|uniref:Beta-lactamase family protein n=2 Tax=Thalassomonas actiniarum TaxID=485447 RepID=A0AAF0C235_9GAMM|nr:serine hydrolase domain-containing protein [Thalassomonas actiniarum]WDD99636.1 beta-lactamase family protein [Thalassomonas actiniarum]